MSHSRRLALGIFAAWGLMWSSVVWPAPAIADTAPAIFLELDVQAGDYPLYRSTVLPPIALDDSAGSAGTWPASASMTLTRECPDGPCPDQPYTVSEVVSFTGSYDPRSQVLTGDVVHTWTSHADEIRDASSATLERLTETVTKGSLRVAWSDGAHRFLGTLEGNEAQTSTVWDYDPGPGWKGRHPVTETSSRAVTWSLRSPEQGSPTEGRTEVTAGGSTGDPPASPGQQAAATPDADGSSFPYLVMVVAVLVLLGIIAAVGVFRSLKARTSPAKTEPQRRAEAREREEREDERRDRQGERDNDQMAAELGLGEEEPDWVHDPIIAPEERRRLEERRRRLQTEFAKWALTATNEETDEDYEKRRRRERATYPQPGDPDYVDVFETGVDDRLADGGRSEL